MDRYRRSRTERTLSSQLKLSLREPDLYRKASLTASNYDRLTGQRACRSKQGVTEVSESRNYPSVFHLLAALQEGTLNGTGDCICAGALVRYVCKTNGTYSVTVL